MAKYSKKSKNKEMRQCKTSDTELYAESLCGDGTSRKYRCNRPRRKVSNVVSYNDSGSCSSPVSSVHLQVEQHFEDIFKTLHQLQRENKYCDVMLQTEEGMVPAHSIVLIAASPTFCKNRKKNQSSEAGDIACTCIDLSHIPHWIIENIVSYIYTGMLTLCNDKVEEFAKHCVSLGLTKLHQKLNSKSVLLPENCQREMKVGSAGANYMMPVEASEDRLLSRQNQSLLRNKRTMPDHEHQDVKAAKSTRKHHNGRVKKVPLDSAEKCNNEAKKSESSDVGDKLAESEKNKYITGSGIQLQTTEAKDDTNDRATNRNETIYFNDKDKHESGQCEDESVTVNEEDGSEHDENNSFEKSADNEYDSDTEIEDYPPNRKLKCNNVTGADEDKAVQDNLKHPQKNNMKVLHCKRCNADFKTAAELKKHRKSCKGNRPRKRCMLCQISFDTAEAYLHHRKTDEKCLAIQKQKHQHRLHKKALLRARYCCRVCPRKFRRVADHIDHEFVAHELPYDKEKWPDLFCEVRTVHFTLVCQTLFSDCVLVSRPLDFPRKVQAPLSSFLV